MICRLCLSNNESVIICGADSREYFLCKNCNLINAHHDYFPAKEVEKERYLTHQNGIEHPGYVEFLSRAINPALRFININMKGLDYGCGYAPTLSKLLGRKGISCDDYDPFFVKKKFNEKFDFIFSTEVFEHFFHPRKEIAKIDELLKPDGLLIVMTERWSSIKQFESWYYTKDPTHISFYHSLTFDYICSNFKYKKLYDDNSRIIILRKV
jgi:SAM-dependent methyltransferase